MDKKVYLDAAATTYINNQVLAEMMPVLTTEYGNPNSLHTFGQNAKRYLDTARKRVADGIGAEPSEIYFTSGGTEADNWAIIGLARANKDKGNHIITSKIEHHAILDACKQLEKEGFKVTYLPVDKYGIVSLSALMHEIRKDTILVSIMVANNEVGTIQNLNAIARTVKEKDIIFHCDAVQALGNIHLNVNELNIDAMSLSSHKIYGPTGAGALYVRKGIKIDSLLKGGSQESGKRGGTVNLPAIVGFGKAVELVTKDVTGNAQKLRHLREYFTKRVMEKIDHVHLLGHPHQRLPGMVTLSFEFVEGEALLMLLDMSGIAVSTGSACTSNSLDPSHVLMAMNIEHDLAQTAVRFSIAKNVTKEDLDYVVNELVKHVKKLREISPLHISVVDDKEGE